MEVVKVRNDRPDLVRVSAQELMILDIAQVVQMLDDKEFKELQKKKHLTTVCGILVEQDTKVPASEVWFEIDGEIVGRITGLAIPIGYES